MTAENDAINSECPICYGKCGQFGFITPCRHAFCGSCFLRSIKRQLTYNSRLRLNLKCVYCQQTYSASKLKLASGDSSGFSEVTPTSSPYNEVYIQGDKIGIASYHFTDNGVYINYENRPPNWMLTNGEAPPTHKYFENVTYDAETREFMGEIVWGDISLEPNITKWIYRFQFSEDFNIIKKGTVDHVSTDGLVDHTSVFGEQLIYCRLGASDELSIQERLGRVYKTNSICSYCSDTLNDPCTPTCGHQLCRQCLLQGIASSDDLCCYICDDHVTLCKSTDEDGNSIHLGIQSPFGHTYVQENSEGPSEGFASYHLSELESFISYSNAPDNWTLENGEKVPPKKPFLNVSYDNVTRTFTGEIAWKIPFGGDTLWKYRLVFSEDFVFIEDGNVQSFKDEGDLTNHTEFSKIKSSERLNYFLYEKDTANALLNKND